MCRRMDIVAYLEKHGLSQEQFAGKIGVTQGAVWQWVNGMTRVSPARAKEIEEKTKGEIKRHDLRPDIFDRARAA